MSERKVLNKYYPPDFDPSKIPRMKCSKNRQFTVRLMAPFNMRCKTCGEYIYKGKKFNARKEDVEGEDYLGIRIFRFYIKCTRCLQEISFKTDPRNTDYEIEAGATRNFMALKLAEEQAEREKEEMREEEASNPMKLLENRTKQSKMELELLESLEELKDLNKRHQNIDFDTMLTQFSSKEAQEAILKMQEEEDERQVKKIFGERKLVTVKEEVLDEEDKPPMKKKRRERDVEVKSEPGSSTSVVKMENDLISTKPAILVTKPDDSWNTSLGCIRRPVGSLVRIKSKAARTIGEETGKEQKTEDVEAASGGSQVKTPSLPGDGTAKPEDIVKKPVISALSMLGSYSGTESDESQS